MLTDFNSLPSRVQAHAGRTTRPLSAGRSETAASRTSFGRPDVASAPSAQAWPKKPLGFYAAVETPLAFFGGNHISALTKNLKQEQL